eukprot:Filipodium_phascolosomae@DN6885_c0_g1_i1.p1
MSGELVSLLMEARFGTTAKIITAPEALTVKTIDEGRAVCKEYVKALKQPIIGWKVGASSDAALAKFGLTEPFYGPLVGTVTSPLVTRKSCLLNLKGFESEYTMKMSKDFPKKSDKSEYTVEEVTGGIELVYTSIEIASTRLRDHWGVIGLIADGGANQMLVLGETVPDWKESAALTENKVTISMNGTEAASGDGKAVLGSPLKALTWLVNALIKDDMTLKKGDLVATGTTTGMVMPPSDAATVEVVSDFGPYGKVEVKLQKEA